MPPKAKTPSKGSAEENPQLNQILAMLQSMTAQINGLSTRIDTMEKKSEAAEVAGQRSERSAASIQKGKGASAS